MRPPTETRYAESDGVHIAYQVVGEGDIDLIFLPMWFSHVELIWEAPRRRTVLERLASFSRLIIFDQRGTGLSDSVAIEDVLTLEDRTKDVLAVLDAAGSERAALFAVGAIDRGLAKSRTGIVLVTPCLLLRLQEEGIADKELSALLARDLLVPVVHDTTYEDLREVSPLLGSRSGLSTAEAPMADVAAKIAELVAL